MSASVAGQVERMPAAFPWREASFPLAAEQRGLWYVQQLAPSCGAYHLVFSAQVRKTGDWPTSLHDLLAQLIADYPVLRTSLPSTSEGPRQVVWSTTNADVRFSDARGMDAEQLREQLRSDTRQPFDLEQAPLWRIHRYQTGDDCWILAVVVHHVLLDFWSLGLLLHDVAGRFGLTEAAVQAPDGIGFGEYAVRQAAKLSNDANMSVWLKHWRNHLQDAPPVHGLPLDYPRPPRQSYEGRSLSFMLPRDVSDGVKRLAQNSEATPFMVLLAAYYVLLHRFSGDTDIVVASPVAGRLERSQRTMLGQFVNTVALRCRIDPAAPFSRLLCWVRHSVIEALRHQQCPFSLVVEELAPRRDPSYAPLAQLGFSWERLPLLADFAEFFMADPAPVKRCGPGFTLQPYAVPQQEGQLDLLLEMGGERDGALVGVLKYHEHLFKKESAAELVQAFISLVSAIVATPDRPISDLDLSGQACLHSWLQRGAGPKLALPDIPVLEQIRRQAARTPDAIAVQDKQTALSYRALLARADQLAFALRQAGLPPESRVGLMLEHCCDLVAAILGTWSAGAAYVPLDPAFPPERLKAIAADAQLAALISHTGLQTLWPDALPVISVDRPLPSMSPTFAPTAGAIAYLMYTSGSAGKPKGVRIGERSVRNFLHAMQELLQFNSDTRLLAVTTHAFDISVLELLLPLLAGGRVVVCERETAMDGVQLAHRLDMDCINVLQATPATWKMLIDANWQGTPALTALCGGETLPPVLADALVQRVGQLWNVYGPTEATVWSTAAHVQAGEPIHLGAPIGNTQLYVLDEQQRPVPPGVLGELWIGGDGLALDYWQMPEHTAQRFTTLPTLPQAGRVYRTGDHVRWSADGLLTYHGRLDSQVKLRGYRIELGEVESVLRRQSDISDAVAIVREDHPGNPRLVAYLVGEHRSPAVLKAALREVLPAYMVPSAFVFLDELPQTANRKVNRKALPVPDDNAPRENFVAPRDATEIQLAQLFTELLGLQQVGIHDDFFALGGHSLLAVQLVAGINRLFGIKLPVASLVQHGSVAALAARLRGEDDAGHSMLLTLRAGKDVQPLWLFHPIGGNVFCYLELTRQADPQRPVLAFQAPGLDAEGEAEVTVEAIARRYVAQLRERQPHGPYLLGGWCFGGVIAFEVARQLRDADEEVRGVALIDTRAPIAVNVPSDGDDATLLSWFARDLAAPFGKSLKIAPETLRALPAEDMFEYVLSVAKERDVLPADADAAQLRRYFEVYLANGIALQMYFPPADTLPVMLVRAVDEQADYGPTLGWSELAPASLTMVELPGDHNSIMYAPQACAVAKAIDVHYTPQPMPGFST